jgi:hypothetical protein
MMLVYIVIKRHGYHDGGDEFVNVFASKSSAQKFMNEEVSKPQFGYDVFAIEVKE